MGGSLDFSSETGNSSFLDQEGTDGFAVKSSMAFQAPKRVTEDYLICWNPRTTPTDAWEDFSVMLGKVRYYGALGKAFETRPSRELPGSAGEAVFLGAYACALRSFGGSVCCRLHEVRGLLQQRLPVRADTRFRDRILWKSAYFDG